MQWIAPSEKDAATDTLEKRQWAAADQFCANSGISVAQYSQPVLGLIFLRFSPNVREIVTAFHFDDAIRNLERAGRIKG